MITVIVKTKIKNYKIGYGMNKMVYKWGDCIQYVC